MGQWEGPIAFEDHMKSQSKTRKGFKDTFLSVFGLSTTQEAG